MGLFVNKINEANELAKELLELLSNSVDEYDGRVKELAENISSVVGDLSSLSNAAAKKMSLKAEESPEGCTDTGVTADLDETVRKNINGFMLKTFGLLPSQVDYDCLIPLSYVMSSTTDSPYLFVKKPFDWHFDDDVHTYGYWNIFETGSLGTWTPALNFWQCLVTNILVSKYRDNLRELLDSRKLGRLADFLLLSFQKVISLNEFWILHVQNRSKLSGAIAEILNLSAIFETDLSAGDPFVLKISEWMFPIILNGIPLYSSSGIREKIEELDYSRLNEDDDILVSAASPQDCIWLGGNLEVFFSYKWPKMFSGEKNIWLIGNEEEDKDCVRFQDIVLVKQRMQVYEPLVTSLVRNEFDVPDNGQFFKYRHCSFNEALDYVYSNYNEYSYGDLIPLLPPEGQNLDRLYQIVPYLTFNFIFATGLLDIQYANVYSMLDKFRTFLGQNDDEESMYDSFVFALRFAKLGQVAALLKKESILELLKYVKLTKKY